MVLIFKAVHPLLRVDCIFLLLREGGVQVAASSICAAGRDLHTLEDRGIRSYIYPTRTQQIEKIAALLDSVLRGISEVTSGE
jgi:hypothetical protein